MASTAAVIDLSSYRKQRTARQEAVLPVATVCWVPVWFCVPLWPNLYPTAHLR